MTSLSKYALAWQLVDVTRTGAMSVPVSIMATRGTCIQEVRVLDAGRSVCVKAHDCPGRRRTWVVWLVIEAGAGVCVRTSPGGDG